MKCKRCGNEMKPNARFCDFCGLPVQNIPPMQMRNAPPQRPCPQNYTYQSTSQFNIQDTASQKPLYKSWAFWFAMIMLSLFLVVVMATFLNPLLQPKNYSSGTYDTAISKTEEITTEKTIEDRIKAVKPGNYIENDNLKFMLKKATVYNEIGEGLFFDESEEGKEYLVLFFDVENMSSKDQYVSDYDYEAYVDDYIIDQKTLLTDIDGYDMLHGDIAPGKKRKGCICYEVNSDWQKFELIFTDGIFSTDPTYEFVVTPDDLS